MSRRTVEGDKSEFTCTILTRDSVGPAAEVHTRMPIALPKETEAAWLDPALTDAPQAIELARENSITDFVLRQVIPRVNSARNEGGGSYRAFSKSGLGRGDFTFCSIWPASGVC